MSDPSAVDPADYPRKVLFVAGAGRSGTSTLAGLMQILGLHVPKPEVVADETNPKGFGEPRWVVDHHDRLLKEARGPGQRRAPGGVVRDRPDLHPRAGADHHRRLARGALRRAAPSWW